jgi:sugar-specific transcriptional regulator TrmB
MYEEILTSLGLTDEQTQIYLSLLSRGPQTVSQLTRSTKVQRTYIYRIAEELIGKGLVAIEGKAKKTTFTPLSPDHLLRQAEDAKTKAERAHLALEGILPRLKEKFSLINQRPVVTYYEGIEGIKKVFVDIYAPKNEPVYGCVDLEKSDTAVPGIVLKDLIPLRIKNKLFAKSFIAASPQAVKLQKKDKESLRESILLDKKEFPIPAEIDIYEDKVAMLCFTKGQFVGILIKNKDIAESLKSIMKLAFENSKKPTQ